MLLDKIMLILPIENKHIREIEGGVKYLIKTMKLRASIAYKH